MKLRVGGFDIETTGLLTPEHRIIEAHLSVYLVDAAQPELHTLVEEKTWRINPERMIDAKAYNVHHIASADLVGCPTLELVAADMGRMLTSCDIVVAHNGDAFDFPFIIQEFERVGQEIPDFEPFDSMTEGRWATPYGKVPSLKELCFACGVPYDTSMAHAAEYDVRCMMASFFFGWAQRFYTPNIPGTKEVPTTP